MPKDVKNDISSSSKKNKVVVTISVILIIISLIVITGALVLNWQPFKNDQDTLDQDIGTPNSLKQKSVNVLICGIDEDEDRGTNLTDVIMVLNFDINSKKASILQIPRDTFIGTSEVYTGKINGIYNSGKNKKGIDGLARVIYNTFSIPIDYYLTITMEGFRTIVDQIGGVEVDVPETFFLEGVLIEEGKQLMNGDQAEKFVRVRSIYYDGDIGRVKAQRIFLAAFAQKMIDTPISDIVKLVPEVAKNVNTNMSVKEIIDFSKLGAGLDLANINIHLLPGEATMNDDQSVYSLHKQKVADLLNTYFRPYTDPVPSEKLKVIELQNTHSYYDDENENLEDVINKNGSFNGED